MTRIRICYIIDNLTFRGGERVFAQLALGLDRNRYDIHVICSPGGRFVEMLEAVDIPVFPVNIRNKWNLLAVLPMAHYLKKHRFDIVHTQGRGDPFGRIAAQLAGAPVLVSTTAAIVSRYWHVEWWRKPLYRLIDRVTDPLVDQYIVVNHASVETLVKDHHIPRNQVTVIQNGVEADQYITSPKARAIWRKRWRVSDDELVVGAIGQLVWEKGFENLVKAWPQVRTQVPKARLCILGEGELEKDLKALAADELADSCTFTGFEPDIPGALAGMDLFVLPSLIEGLPMVLLEAMAAGKPVVASRIVGCQEVITENVDGVLVELGSVEALAGALVHLLQSPDLAARLGSAAQSTARQRFTVERMVQETNDLYLSLIARSRERTGHDQDIFRTNFLAKPE